MKNIILNEQQQQIAKYIIDKIDAHNEQSTTLRTLSKYLANEWGGFIMKCKEELNVPQEYMFLVDKMAFVEKDDVVE